MSGLFEVCDNRSSTESHANNSVAIRTTSILGPAFGPDQAIEFVPYKGPLSYIKESNGSRCGWFVINPTDLDVDKVLAGGRGISDTSTSRMMGSWFTEKFIEEAGMRVAQSLADPGNAHGMYFEVCNKSFNSASYLSIQLIYF
jgi:hypothetical protein